MIQHGPRILVINAMDHLNEYPKPSSSNHWYVFGFEENFNYKSAHQWMTENWTNMFYYCAVYVVLVFGIRWIMSDRASFKLKGLLILWNIMLATFSVVGFARSAPELFRLWNTYGMHYTVCVSR